MLSHAFDRSLAETLELPEHWLLKVDDPPRVPFLRVEEAAVGVKSWPAICISGSAFVPPFSLEPRLPLVTHGLVTELRLRK